MKKLISILSVIFVCFILFGCGKSEPSLLTKKNIINLATVKLEIGAPYEFNWKIENHTDKILNNEISQITIRTDHTKNEYNIVTVQILDNFYNPINMGILNDKGKETVMKEEIEKSINVIRYYFVDKKAQNVSSATSDVTVAGMPAKKFTIKYTTKANRNLVSDCYYFHNLKEMWQIRFIYVQNDEKAAKCVKQMAESIKITNN